MQSSPVNLNFPLFFSVFSEMKNLRVFEVDDNWDLFPWSLDILSENAHLNRVVANFCQDYFPTIVWQNPKSIKHLEIKGNIDLNALAASQDFSISGNKGWSRFLPNL